MPRIFDDIENALIHEQVQERTEGPSAIVYPTQKGGMFLALILFKTTCL